VKGGSDDLYRTLIFGMERVGRGKTSKFDCIKARTLKQTKTVAFHPDLLAKHNLELSTHLENSLIKCEQLRGVLGFIAKQSVMAILVSTQSGRTGASLT